MYAATYLLAVDWRLNPVTHLAIVGEAHDLTTQAMRRAALATFLPRRVVQLVAPDAADRQFLPPALRGMLSAGQAPRGYACTGTACSQPAADLASWEATLDSLRDAFTTSG